MKDLSIHFNALSALTSAPVQLLFSAKGQNSSYLAASESYAPPPPPLLPIIRRNSQPSAADFAPPITPKKPSPPSLAL